MFVSVQQLIERSRAVLDDWAGVDWAACDPGAVSVAAVQLVRDADRLRAVALLAVAEHEKRGGTRQEGDGSTADWLARTAKVSKPKAARTARAAATTATAPGTARAVAEGVLSQDQAELLLGAVSDATAEAYRAQEARLIEEASDSVEAAAETAARFRASCGETPTQAAERRFAARSASAWVGDDQMVHGRQCLAGDDGATFRNTFQAFVDREFHRRERDHRTAAQRRADAAVEMARFAAAALNGTAPTARPVPTVVVHVDYEGLVATGDGGTGEDETTGVPLSGEAARRLACDAGVVRMITAGRSEILDVGRKTRTIPTAIRRQVIARDGGCTFPGCTAPPDWVQVHHVVHWAHLGATEPGNLVCGCHRHHRLVHEGGWGLTLDPVTQRTIWRSPSGRVLIGQRRSTGQRRAA